MQWLDSQCYTGWRRQGHSWLDSQPYTEWRRQEQSWLLTKQQVLADTVKTALNATLQLFLESTFLAKHSGSGL